MEKNKKNFIFVISAIFIFSFILSLQVAKAEGCYRWETVVAKDFQIYYDSLGVLRFVRFLETYSSQPVCMEWKSGRHLFTGDTSDTVDSCNTDKDCPGEGRWVYSLLQTGWSGYTDAGVWNKDAFKIYLCEKVLGRCEEKVLWQNYCQNNEECLKISSATKGTDNFGKIKCDTSRIPYSCVAPANIFEKLSIMDKNYLFYIVGGFAVLLILFFVIRKIKKNYRFQLKMF